MSTRSQMKRSSKEVIQSRTGEENQKTKTKKSVALISPEVIMLHNNIQICAVESSSARGSSAAKPVGLFRHDIDIATTLFLGPNGTSLARLRSTDQVIDRAGVAQRGARS